MMMNSKFSASKKKQGSPRSPLKLKDLNVASSSSSSLSSSFSSSATATSISSEGPKGCLRFFLSHHHSSAVSRNASANKTPKSAPNVRNLRGNVVKKRSNLPNPDKFTTRKVKKNPPVPHSLKSGEKFSSRYDLSHGVNKFTSGFQVKLSDDSENGVKLRKPSSRYDVSDGISKNSNGFELKLSDDAANGRKPGSRYDFSDGMSRFSTGFQVNVSDSTEEFTPVNKLGCGFGSVSFSRNNKAVKIVGNGANCADPSRSPTPPLVQPSVSPEIQVGLSSVVAATPTTCYAAGHVLSGVTDKRKCRPKGILTIGNNDLFGSSKTKGSHNDSESVVWELNNRRDSIIPSPTEASVCWLSSPCDAKRSKGRDDADGNTSELRLNECEKLVPFELVGCSSSPSSSLGFSSELFNKSNCTVSTSDASTATPNSRRSKSSVLHSDLSSEFRGVLGPSLDHLVRSPSPPSPIATPTSKFEFSPEQGKFRYENERQGSPDLEDSLGSGNIMQTPESNSSRCNFRLSRQSPKSNSRSPNFGLSELSRDQISRLWFECELDSVAEVLRRVSVSPDCQISELDSPRPSFEFNPLIKLDSSIDFALFRKAMDTGTSDISEALMHSLPEEPEVRISWREGLASRMFEMDELDCCRYLSDEEDNANESKDASECCPRLEVDATVSNDIAEDTCDPTTSLQHEESISSKHEENPSSEGQKSCPESINDDGRCGHVPEEPSWSVCYKNNLFQV